MNPRFRQQLLLGCCTAALTSAAIAHENHAPILEEVVVFGRSLQLIGNADSASEGLVGYADLQLPPLLRVGELAEAVPGMVATQHSGTGKANQYYLRGFNLDHGTDFSAELDGVPLNMRTHGHGQGYLDLNFMIPELLATTRYRKGTYAAQDGDFSSAGSVEFAYYDELPQSMLELTLGENNFQRALLAGTQVLGSGALTAALDVTRNEGPWELDENLEQEKVYLNYRTAIADVPTEFTLDGYFSDWDATDQVPLRAVEAGMIDRFGFIDPDLGGSTHRVAFNASADLGRNQINAYIIDYDFSLFSNFTYMLENDVAGDEFEQRDERRIYGINFDGSVEVFFDALPFRLSWGADARFDDIDAVGLYQTATRQRLNTVRQDAVEEFSASAYGDIQFALSERWRLGLGARVDHYDWQVDSDTALNSGSGDDVLVSPKLRLAWLATENLELYANYGRGMHSNDVRGATINVDPLSGETVDAVDVLVPSEGSEVGIRLELGDNFNATMVAYWLDIDSELVFVGDAGGTEPNDGSKRQGFETAVFWQMTNWLAVNADYSKTDARFTGVPSAVDAIPGAIESSFSLGLNTMWQNGISASLQWRYLGESPLDEAESLTAPSSSLLNLGVAYERNNLELRIELFNALDSSDYDVAYLYESRLQNEPAGGFSDIHFHPLEPRTARLSVKYNF